MTSSHDRDWACAVLRWTQTVLQDPRMLATARQTCTEQHYNCTTVFSCLLAGVLGTVLGTIPGTRYRYYEVSYGGGTQVRFLPSAAPCIRAVGLWTLGRVSYGSLAHGEVHPIPLG